MFQIQGNLLRLECKNRKESYNSLMPLLFQEKTVYQPLLRVEIHGLSKHF